MLRLGATADRQKLLIDQKTMLSLLISSSRPTLSRRSKWLNLAV